MSTKKARYTIFHNSHLFLSTGKTEQLNARLFLLLPSKSTFMPKYSTEKKNTHSDFSLGWRTARLWRKRRDSSDEPFGGLKEIQLNLFLQKLFFPHLGHLNFLFVKVCVPKIKSFIDGTNFSPQFGHS